jgi:hypothetical protein
MGQSVGIAEYLNNYTDNQIRTDDVYLEGRSYTYLTIPAILIEGVNLFIT